MSNVKIKIVPEEPSDKKERMLNEFIIVLRRSILDWEETMRGKLNNPYFDAYEELALLVGIHPQTLRK